MSHEVSPLMKLVGRGDTTVVDAYLSPILRDYVDRVAAETGDVRLMFMQSNGGLVDARLFQGKDAILSGPAGGIVGAAKTAALAGLDRIVGFDMGGTSTDVTHYAGAFERAFDTEVAGVRIRAPMMKIHTVAAGGGSIISFDGQRFRVGPESAGANPGPACYRRGGPLAVTDANLMVGKLLPDFFPHVFGAGGRPAAGRRGGPRAPSRPWRTRSRRSTGIERTPEELAHGCLAIANDNMANAIKEISVQRGIDVTAATRCAASAAPARSMPARWRTCWASAGSSSTPTPRSCRPTAWASPTLRVLRQQAIERPLDAGADRRARGGGAPSSAPRPCAELRAQDVPRTRASTLEARVHVRYAGTDTSLEVPLADAAALRAAFEAEHRVALRLHRRGPRAWWSRR